MTITHFGAFNAEGLGLTIDAFAAGALVVDDLIEGAIAIECHAHLAAQFPVDIFDTAFAEGLLDMIADLAGRERRRGRGNGSAGRGTHWYDRTGRWAACATLWDTAGCRRHRARRPDGRAGWDHHIFSGESDAKM